jgi:hypothetical protein
MKRRPIMTTLTAAPLVRRSQAHLDGLFRRSPAGPIPQGDTAGIAIIAPGTPLSTMLARFVHLVAWQGKVFDPTSGTLRNKITPFGIRAIPAQVYKATSWVDGRECIVLDYSKSWLVARWIRDEIREVAPGQYLGVVFVGRVKVLNFALRLPARRG